MPAWARCSTRSRSRASAPQKSPTGCSTSPAPPPPSSGKLTSTRSFETPFRCSSTSSRPHKLTSISTSRGTAPHSRQLRQASAGLPQSAAQRQGSHARRRCPARLTLVNGHVAAVITDSGSGIAPEHLKRIYDPFFTTKTTPKPGDRRGTGLGLSVSYGIIQEHAGKIHVESAVGAGTTFHLEFPLLRNSVHA
jgi:hypothetical protein